MRSRISHVNQYIVVGFTLFNLICIEYIIYFAVERWFLFSIFIANLVILWYFVFLNARYWKEHEKILSDFSLFMRNKWGKILFSQEEEFDENARFLSLIKRTYVEQNLLKKDYSELQGVFEKFIPKKIHDEIGFKGYERIVLGAAVTKTLTIMFLDIVWFSSVSEEIHNPYRTLLLLNIYFDGIGEIVYRNNGYIDKYLGDGILIIFDQASSDDAIKASIEIQEFIKQFQVGAIGRSIRVGIWINRGEVTIGTIGTHSRMDATVIGDAVNIASRLEHLTRTYDAGIIMSESTYEKLESKEKFSIDFISDEHIKWRNTPVKIYSVGGFSSEQVSLEIKNIA
jgi:class 3 adenylate cyclase